MSDTAEQTNKIVATIHADTQDQADANARLYSAAHDSYYKHCGARAVECAEADLLGEALGSLKHGAQVNLPDFLDWLADRLVIVYGESPNVDFVHTCRDRAKLARAVLAKARPA